ncbi:MAG TPA: hypothetical protein VFE46_00295 [Pirellulales bacterium]|jgi:hypothetical protein|nr:hypothetical protein [Pirellulales bacterium]
MLAKRAWFLAMVCLLAVSAGCTHVQLRKNSVHEAATVGDIQQQEVLDNLALFVYDYNSMPYFSYPLQGGASVTDQAGSGITPSFGRPITQGLQFSAATGRFTRPPFFLSFMLSTLGLSATAQRQCQDSFTMIPVNDPRKLELMRCAYQTAVGNCGYGPAPRNCPDCQARFNTFYTGDPEGKISQSNSGIITSECLKGPCWLHVGCEKEIPKDCCCIPVGHYCHVYVWVGPEGRDELTKLTLAILDYALHDPPGRLTKDVTYYVDALGLPTSQKDGVATIKATIGINERPEGLLNLPPAQEVELEQQLQDRIRRLTAMLETVDPKDSEKRKNLNDEIEDARQKLYFLDQQLKNGGLKEQFGPAGAAPVSPYGGILQFQQQLNLSNPPPLAVPAQ